MAGVSNKIQAELPRIKENVDNWHAYFKDNIDTFHAMRSFVFKSNLNANDLMVLEQTKKPKIEFNILGSYISRLRGEFSKQMPTLTVSGCENAKTDAKTIQIVEDHVRASMFYANKNTAMYSVYTDLLSGGFSALKVWTEYENQMSFHQNILWDRVYDPTLTFFDPLARLPHKGDGNYAGDLFPKRKKDFQIEYPEIDIRSITYSRTEGKFSWSYNNQREDILLIADYYERKKKHTKIVQLSNGKTLPKDKYKAYMEQWQAAGHLEQPAVITNERWTDVETICRYRFIEDQIIEYVETDFKLLPRVFVDGDSILLRDSTDSSVKQTVRPYISNAVGAQKLKNFAGQCLANELENMVQHKWVMSEESISPEYAAALKMPQLPSLVIYKELYNNDPTIRLTAPREVQRPPIPQEISGTFMMTDQLTQMILGSFDASLGINNNQLSGVAIIEGATQSNAAAMPFVVSMMQSLTQIGQIYVDLLPKYYTTPRTIPIVGADGKHSYLAINGSGQPQIKYDDNVLNVEVEAGVNFAIQKSRSLQQMTAVMGASPGFAAFMNENVPLLVRNMEVDGQDQFEDAAQAWQKKQQMMQAKASQQPNPLMMKMQLEQQKLQQKGQQDQSENYYRGIELANDAKSTQNDEMKIQLQAQQAGMENQVQLKKADAEEFSRMADLALAGSDQAHRQTHDNIQRAHEHVRLQHELNKPQNPQK